MTKSRSIAQNILIWTYERGTLQYDIICILILAFIFFVPPSCFHRRTGMEVRPLNRTSEPPGSDKPAPDHRDLLNETK